MLLRPAALPTGYYDPLFERPDLTEDDYHRLRQPSRLTAARRKAVTPPNPDSHGYPGRTARRTSRRRRVTVRLSAASVADLSQGAPNRAICMLPTVRWARPQRRVIGRELVAHIPVSYPQADSSVASSSVVTMAFT